MIRHIVLVKFRADVTPAERTAIFEALASLKDRIDGLVGTSFGPNVSPEGKDLGFADGFVMDFRDAAARDAYLVDAEHQRLGGVMVAALEGGRDGLIVIDIDA
jgi:hypothetical protein